MENKNFSIMEARNRAKCNPREKLSKEEVEILYAVFGMWAERDDIDDNWVIEGRNNWYSDWKGDKPL